MSFTDRIVRVQHDGLTLTLARDDDDDDDDDAREVKVLPRGVESLPVSNDAFRLALRWTSGAELTRDGDVFVLVNLPATCGNDPVNELVARVSIAELIAISEDHRIDRSDIVTIDALRAP